MSNYSPEELVELVRKFGMERDRYVTLLARESNIGRTEFVALDHMQEAGELTPAQLAERLVLTSGATTAVVDRLEAAGMVTRNPHPEDRRSWLLRLTKRSNEAGTKQLSPYLKELEAAARRLTAADRSAVGAFLEAAAAAAAKHAEKSSQRVADGKTTRRA